MDTQEQLKKIIESCEIENETSCFHCGEEYAEMGIDKYKLASAILSAGYVKLSEVKKGKISDGYHTFNELYDHRVLLWICVVNFTPQKAYLIKEHYPGWFLLGLETSKGQISYHCPNKYLNLIHNEIKELANDTNYDGHTSNDVIKRLKIYAQEIIKFEEE